MQLAEITQSATKQGYQSVRLFTQDESRVGLLPIIRHRISARGVQPTIASHYSFENFYLYGAVEPVTGESFFLELPYLNTENFQIFVDQFSQAFSTSFNILLLDNGAFHKAKALKLADNIAAIFFPPYSPELNPIERLWRDIKDRLSRYRPDSLDGLFEIVAQIIPGYSNHDIHSLTAYPYLVNIISSANVYPS